MDSPTHAQHHNLFSIDSSFDPATHLDAPGGTASRPVTKNPFLRYPLAYIGRTISEFDSSCLADRKQPHRFAIYEDDLRQIERQSVFLSSDHFSKSFHVFSTDSPTQTQHHNLFSIDSSFDPATHRG